MGWIRVRPPVRRPDHRALPDGSRGHGLELYEELLPTGAHEIWTERGQHIWLSEMEPAGDVYRWDAGDLVAGTYQVVVEPHQSHTVVEVSPPDASQLRIVVPEPEDVRVVVIDEATRERLRDPRLDWSRGIPVAGSSSGSSLVDAAVSGELRFQAPAGPIRLSVRHRGYFSASEFLSIERGLNEIVVPLSRAHAIRIRLMDGDARVPWDWIRPWEVTALDGSGERVSRGPDGVTVSEPGRYAIDIGELEGFEPVPVQTVTIEAGVVAELVIQLERTRR